MKELSSDLHRLLDAERGPVPSAPAGARDRVLSRVQSTLGLPAVPAAVPVVPAAAPVPPPVAPAPAASALPGAARWTGAFLLGVAASALVYLVVRALQPAPVATVPMAAAAVVAPVAGAAPGGSAVALAADANAARPASADPSIAAALPAAPIAAAPAVGGGALPRDKASRRSRARFASTVEPDSDLEAERALLDLARDALQRKDTAAALDVTRQHERRFPRGLLTEERELLVIRVLVGGNQRSAAEARALAFRQRFPHSIFLPAVDAVLP